ncbi:hypothetical protein HYU14_06795 [Candidatus Woesearchaeota archaeon]|nr:hypothetical protein [Candidatus Woesearchaeota archaeon]
MRALIAPPVIALIILAIIVSGCATQFPSQQGMEGQGRQQSQSDGSMGTETARSPDQVREAGLQDLDIAMAELDELE